MLAASITSGATMPPVAITRTKPGDRERAVAEAAATAAPPARYE